MESKPYLIFNLHGLPYGIDANYVEEIFLLPELIPVTEAPADIIGLLDFRSRIVPLMHLALRFGHHLDGCNLNDCAIVVDSQGLQIGFVVHEVKEVYYIEPNAIQTDLSYGRDRDINSVFIAGVVEIADEIVFLLNLDNLVRHPDAVASLVEDANESSEEELLTTKPVGSFYDLYFPQATAKQRAIMRQRAEELKTHKATEESVELHSLAVVKIGDEYFGIDLDLVREFAKIGNVTAIPRCPSHIVGNTNLRGEILTLVDLQQAINLPNNQQSSFTKAVAVDVDDIFAGIVVDEVLDVMTYYPEALSSLPLALDSNTSQYFKGTTSYLGKAIGIIDLSKMLSQGLLTVNL